MYSLNFLPVYKINIDYIIGLTCIFNLWILFAISRNLTFIKLYKCLHHIKSFGKCPASEAEL